MEKQLLTHPLFSKIVVNGQTIARIDKQTGGLWSRTEYATGLNEVGTAEQAIAWISALSLAVALS